MKKEFVALATLAVLTVVALFLANPTLPTEPDRSSRPFEAVALGPYDPTGREATLRYRHEGGFSLLEEVEIVCRRAADGTVACDVAYKARGGDETVRRAHALGAPAFDEALKLFERAGFFDVEPVARSQYVADLGTTVVALAVGERSHEVRVDGRRRPSRDLGPVLAFFGRILKSATPEAVASGD